MTQKPKLALIGGAGFIGHNAALNFKKKGYDVHVLDSLQVNNLLSFAATDQEVMNRDLYLNIIQERMQLLREAEIPVHIQDAREYHMLTNTLNRIKPDTIVLLAAVAHANRSNKDPYSTFDHSLRTLENALDYSRSADVNHFVYFSSSMVYGNFESGFVTEKSECNPLGIYGALKFAGEKIVIAYNQVFDLPYTIIRPSALYGERCVSRRVGQIFIENALQGLDVTINGDGEDRLDFTYIGDLVQGLERVVAEPASRNQVFNLTYGESRSIAQMADILKEKFPDLRMHFKERDKLMPARGTLSVEKARELIGYQPKFPLERGFVEYIDWYQSRWKKISASYKQ